MAHVVAIGDPVEVEEHGVEPGTQDQTALFVPGEGVALPRPPPST